MECYFVIGDEFSSFWNRFYHKNFIFWTLSYIFQLNERLLSLIDIGIKGHLLSTYFLQWYFIFYHHWSSSGLALNRHYAIPKLTRKLGQKYTHIGPSTLNVLSLLLMLTTLALMSLNHPDEITSLNVPKLSGRVIWFRQFGFLFSMTDNYNSKNDNWYFVQ